MCTIPVLLRCAIVRSVGCRAGERAVRRARFGFFSRAGLHSSQREPQIEGTHGSSTISLTQIEARLRVDGVEQFVLEVLLVRIRRQLQQANTR